MSLPTISVERADVLDFPSEVLVLKYAQALYGADGLVADRLMGPSNNHSQLSPPPGTHVLLSSNGNVAAQNVLFMGVCGLYEFGYPEIREFAITSLKVLADELPEVEQVSMTMHGVGYGLDEREAFLAQVGGLIEAFKLREMPKYLEKVTIVESDERRAARLTQLLQANLPGKYMAVTSRATRSVSSTPTMEAGVKTKPHVFVAMPFGEDMEDVYLFGIQGPAHAAGYLCERVDMSVFTGDILARIKSRIETASLVIADVTGANPNVYLEVGYAWGKDRPTLILVKIGEELKYDISSQRCIRYKSINDLAKQLDMVLKGLAEVS